MIDNPQSINQIRIYENHNLAYYHEDRTHIGLNKTTPAKRPIELRPTETSRIRSLPRIGGLHQHGSSFLSSQLRQPIWRSIWAICMCDLTVESEVRLTCLPRKRSSVVGLRPDLLDLMTYTGHVANPSATGMLTSDTVYVQNIQPEKCLLLWLFIG